MQASPAKIAVSSCLLGNPVRYDGRDQRHDLIIDMLNKHFECVIVCPEMLAGLGTPRPPVQLVKFAEGIHAIGVEDHQLDVTVAIELAVEKFIGQHTELAGCILKSRSPSCGHGSTPLFNTQDEILELGNGLFANKIISHFPELPIKEDTWFVDDKSVREFMRLVERYRSKMTVS